MNEDIEVTFIIPEDCDSENDCSEDMKQAFIACEQHSGGGLHAKFVHESKYDKFDGLTKRDVFVFSQFEGVLYDRLRTTKCLLVGPRCLLCCLTEGVPIPSGPEPVFTIAMRGLVVTASGLTKTQKENIKKKVHWMGGIYKTVLTDDTTHLVSDTVLSDKYIKSVEKNIPIMKESWIEAVWEASLYQNINGSSSDFNVHFLPPFANLQVTTSGITKKEKQLITKLITENGGTFSGAFQSETTDIVVLNKEGVGSEKYKAGVEYGKACVSPSWVIQSAAAGRALPLAAFRVAGAATSSPRAEHKLPDMSLNFSCITNVRPPSNFVDETRSADVTALSGKVKLFQENKKSDTSIDQEIINELENFDMSLLKNVGPIFDGFCMWVCGLPDAARERAVRVVTRGGGVRLDGALPALTHVVCTPGHVRTAKQAAPHAPALSPRWLLDSVRAGRALAEGEFLLDTDPKTPAKSARKMNPETASPMSKRNLQLLRRGPLNLPPPTVEPEEPQDDLVNHYLSQQMPEEPPQAKTPVKPSNTTDTTLRHNPDITDDVTHELTEEVEQIFRGIKLEVQGLDEEAMCELSAEIAAAGGVVCAAGAGGSHVLVPLDFDTDELITKEAEPVTVFWVKDCLSQGELVPPQYFHRPVRLAGRPLAGVVASLSTYSGLERAFLDELAQLLGATTQLRFCRRNTANALASTHLICPEPSGDKYAGCVKWGLPAVRGEWLLACVGGRVSERPYLVGGTRAPPSPQKPAEEAIPQNTDKPTNVAMNKENAMLPPEDNVVPRRTSVPSREQTPKANNAVTDDMSPASRYIAMARQGLLGGDSQETPKRADKDEDSIKAPSPGVWSPLVSAASPATRRVLQAVRSGDVPPDAIKTPVDPFERLAPPTPDSAFGAALRPGSALSPGGRKALWRVVTDLPGKQDKTPRAHHTPLSEIRNRFLAQFNADATTPPSDYQVAPRKLLLQDQADTPPAKMARMSIDQSPGSAMNKIEDFDPSTDPEDLKTDESVTKPAAPPALPPAVDAQLQRLTAALAGRQSRRRTRDSLSVPVQAVPDSEPAPDSQPNTVGWDDTTPAPQEPPTPETKIFMLSSNVDNREEITEMIIYLGGEVSEGGDSCTHLVCAAPGRSEKMLGSVAAGRWVLHPAYVTRSRAAGRFLPEEEFEWGNPVATCLPGVSPAEAPLARAAHRWRAARGRAAPYAGLVAALHVAPPRRQLLARLVTAGGGTVVDLDPAHSDESITVCFADVKRYPLSARDAAWLRARRIPVCAPVLLSAYLTDETPPDPWEHCLPEFKV